MNLVQELQWPRTVEVIPQNADQIFKFRNNNQLYLKISESSLDPLDLGEYLSIDLFQESVGLGH